MALEILKRIFKYNQMTLDDPDTTMTPDQVMNFWAGVYPELTQATIEGPETTVDGLVFEFSKVAGTKGAKKSSDVITIQDVARGVLSKHVVKRMSMKDLAAMQTILLGGDNSSGAILPPSSAQGMI